MKPELEVETFVEDTIRGLKRIEFNARKAARRVAELVELRQKAEELGIEFVEVEKKSDN